jgi:serine/threonine protein kinase
MGKAHTPYLPAPYLAGDTAATATARVSGLAGGSLGTGTLVAVTAGCGTLRTGRGGFLGVGRVDGLQPGDPRQIGPFRLTGRLGEGGMGRVFLGTSPGGRKVAIKIVHPHYANDPGFRQRFAREVATARQVGGFHTAAVVDADPDADPPWMATAYIAGPSLADAVAERGPFEEAAVRELGASLAEGLIAIHDCGLIHRDLKPGNVILGDDGPRIIDFGIAKGADATTLTGSNTVIGTLRYMSPEQLHGHELTPQSDVFALGTILAFAATGHDPFQAATIPAVITRILHEPPDLDPLTGDLRAIIADCLAKDPGARPSPRDVLARFSRPARHDPTLAAAPAPAPVPRTAPPPGQPAHSTAPQPPQDSTIDVGVMSRPPASPPAAKPPAARPPAAPALRTPGHRTPGHRGRTALIAAGAVALAGLTTLVALMLGNHPAGTQSATGEHTATPPVTGTHSATPAASAQTVAARITATLTDPAAGGVNSVAFGPDGTLATAGATTYLWNTATGQVTATLTDPAGGSSDLVAFGPDGTLVTVDQNGTYLWNTTTGQMTATLTFPIDKDPDAVSFASDGTLATSDQYNTICLWNTSGQKTATFQGHAWVLSMAFGPNGILAIGAANGEIYLWNTATGQLTATLTDPTHNSVYSVAFGPDGTLATGDHSGTTYLWNTATGQITAALTDPTRNNNVSPMPSSKVVYSVAFGPDGTLATGSNLGSTYLWDTRTGKVIATLTDPKSLGVYSVAFGAGGILATGDQNGSTYLWDITDGAS